MTGHQQVPTGEGDTLSIGRDARAELSASHARFFARYIAASRSWLPGGSGPRASLRALAIATMVANVGASASAGLNDVEVLVIEGSPTAGSSGEPVLSLNAPFTTSDGRIAFVGGLPNGLGGTDHFVWFNGEIVWRNSDALPLMLTSAEGTMGVSSSGSWIYSPAVDGLDAVWGANGLIFIEGEPAPGFPGQFVTFCSRPQMNADGTPTWISGVALRGQSTAFRVLYFDGVPALAGGDVVSGQTISLGSGLSFEYDYSPNGQHLVARAAIVAPTASDAVVIVNDAIVARESESTGAGDAWQNFGAVAMGNDGTFVFTGDTNAATATDGFLARNGSIILREGALVGGLGTLAGNPSAASLNELGQITVVWDSSGGEALLLVEPASGGAPQAVSVLLKVGDEVDIDGDGLIDANIEDFNATAASGPGIAFANQCRICVEVDVLVTGGASLEAVVCVAPPAQSCPLDFNGDGEVSGADLAELLGGFGGPGTADVNCDGVVDGADLAEVLGAWGTCPFEGPPQCESATHDCCTPGFAGCTDLDCCALVCSEDPFCCQLLWDTACVGLAAQLCGLSCPPAACYTLNDCCTPFFLGGCNDVDCCQLVCSLDPSCCESMWDVDCASLAIGTCDVCPPASCFDADHNCCELGGPGCSDIECCGAVCQGDPHCCDSVWDETCVLAAIAICGESCGGCGVSQHECCVIGDPGCSDIGCCQSVCTLDPSCCDLFWDLDCVSLANVICEGPPCICFGHSVHDCCTDGGPGCTDIDCCGDVCARDPFCCETLWDASCVVLANTLCGGCSQPLACFNSDHTCCESGAPGCSEVTCCDVVCAVDFFCCSTAWDAVCVDEATDFCNLPCDTCGVTPHDCCVAGDPGCADYACCQTVCSIEPFCCDVIWDVSCVALATQCCGICEFESCLTSTHSCFVQGGPGCAWVECCILVCTFDPFCCDNGWDSACVTQAVDAC